MNKSLIVSQRLQNQRLTSTDFKRPVEVVRWLGAVQAQDFGAAKWAIAQRMQNATNESIEQDFNDGKVIRTHVMRPTWHFVSPEDIRWLLELTAPRVNIASGSAYRKFELDDRVFKQTTKVLTRALKGRKYLTRSALKKILNESGVPADNGIRLGYILIRAELDALICSGPRDGNQFTYALLEERVPQTMRVDREKALATLTQRYFTSHGPATVQDFMWWSGLTAIDAKTGINIVQRRLTKTSDGDKVLWGPEDGVAVTRRPSSASLLAEFDEYVVAYKDRSAVFDSNDHLAMANGALGRTVIIDGKIVGSWKQMKETGSLKISVRLFRALTESERLAIAKAVDRYAKFRGVETKSCLIVEA
jgi:DNA glycosylase AlkZ-like